MGDRPQTEGLRPCEAGGVQQPVTSVENINMRTVAGESFHPKREQDGEGEEEEEQVEEEDEDLWEEQEDEDEEEEGVEELQGQVGEARSTGLEPVDDLAKFIQVEEVQM